MDVNERENCAEKFYRNWYRWVNRALAIYQEELNKISMASRLTAKVSTSIIDQLRMQWGKLKHLPLSNRIYFYFYYKWLNYTVTTLINNCSCVGAVWLKEE